MSSLKQQLTAMALPAYLAASAVLLYYTFTADLRNSAAGTLVILAGVPVFYFFKARRKT